MDRLEQLNARFGRGGELGFRDLAARFPVVDVRNRHAAATIALQGAQIIHWQPGGEQPVIWLSDLARFAAGSSIRGGAPVCWPWFGPHPTDTSMPSHGFARTSPWALVEADSCADGSTQLLLELEPGAGKRPGWPHATRLRSRVNVGMSLSIELVTVNEGELTVTLSQALHSYFRVGDIGTVEVLGLDGREYLDKVDEGRRKRQHGPVGIAGEVDRIYLATGPACEIRDAALGRRIHISSEGSCSTVVWNPWQAKAERLGDLGPDGYRHMLCVETANAAEDARRLGPGAQHRLRAEYRVAPL